MTNRIHVQFTCAASRLSRLSLSFPPFVSCPPPPHRSSVARTPQSTRSLVACRFPSPGFATARETRMGFSRRRRAEINKRKCQSESLGVPVRNSCQYCVNLPQGPPVNVTSSRHVTSVPVLPLNETGGRHRGAVNVVPPDLGNARYVQSREQFDLGRDFVLVRKQLDLVHPRGVV